MNILNNGTIKINNQNYNYKLIDTIGLINLIISDNKFIKNLENTIKIYRNNQNFNILNLIKEHIYHNENKNNKNGYVDIGIYFIIYKGDDIISTLRFIYNLKKKYGYFNLIYTNLDYRRKKICQHNIKYIIDLTKKYINKYELEVDPDNIPALKCYENNGFVKIKENIINNKNYYLMQLKLKSI
jgi:ribosomal protein S18 acetylase RimI-like enzyme